MSVVADRPGAIRRFGFVSVLWWIAFVASIIDVVQSHMLTVIRGVFLVVSLFLASFFTLTWWTLKKGKDPE